MTDTPAWYDDVALPALLRGARATYGSAIRSALTEAGYEDLPRNGSFVVGAIARTGSPLSEVIKSLGVSKQAAGQLVDTLVLRGYLDRAPDIEDRRRMTVTLTERGRMAASVVRAAVDQVDSALTSRVGIDHVAHTRATLGALIGAQHSHDTAQHSHDTAQHSHDTAQHSHDTKADHDGS
jgi:DNA-binding MarR family transcriptional regulator